MYEKMTTSEVYAKLASSEKGLGTQEVNHRLEKHGENKFAEKIQRTKLQMFLAQLNDPMIYILMAATLISCILKEFSDAIIILAVILLNATIGMIQESKAEKSLEALKKLSSPTAMVKRDDKTCEIPAQSLVPGDIVILEAGRIVPADLRLTLSVNLKIEESALTGESVPVEKDALFIACEDVTLGDRINMAYLSTHVSYGRGEGVVVATGMSTEIGKIAGMINEAVDSMTPLQKRLADLGKLLGVIAVAICIAMFALAMAQGRDVIEMLLTAISLAVAAVPEGLPAVVTIVLALGVQRMVRVNTIVRRLPAVETLGSVSIVCSDKTGTLTQNKMTVIKTYINGETHDLNNVSAYDFKILLEGFVLCSDAKIEDGNRLGDPTELALIDMGVKHGVIKTEIEMAYPRINELPFDSDRKMMTTVHKDASGSILSYTKGAMDVILKKCVKISTNNTIRDINADDLHGIATAASEMSTGALRVLALAVKYGDESASEENLCFVGLVGMIDPEREEAKEAVKIFKQAGIRTIMITGDHKDTALAIAKNLDIAKDISECMTGDELNMVSQEELNAKVQGLRVFARVSPEHKVMIVKAFKSHGYIVSMTGDGVNDAPSLKAADIGVAMGITGTDVAKGASDMVLADDNFASIQKAVEEGRNIYNNIKKSVLFLLSANFGEIITMLVPISLALMAPLQATHILWVNLVTDSLPALALGIDPRDKDIMKEPPRDANEKLFAKGGLALTLFYGLIIGGITLIAFAFPLIRYLTESGLAITLDNIKSLDGHESLIRTAQTYAFSTLAASQLFHAIGMRNIKKSIFTFNHAENKLMIIALFAGIALQLAVTEIPFFIHAFETSPLGAFEWLEILLLSSTPLWVHEILVVLGNLLNQVSKQDVNR